ncbi:MAG TPA: LysM peptidoglycan-binding domain-containing protein [Chloroflexota bacterium]|jgi:putative chitinase
MSRHSWIFAVSLLPALLAACGPGTGGSSPSPTVTASAPHLATEAAVYTVKSGDTLSSIAADNKSSVDAIVQANNLTDPDKLQVGQKLAIPSVAGPASGAPATSGVTGSLPPAASKPPPP